MSLKTRHLPCFFRSAFCFRRLILHPLATLSDLNNLGHLNASPIVRAKIWKPSFFSLLCEDARYKEFCKTFFTANLRSAFELSACSDFSKVTLLCVVKDDLARMRMLLDWYRGLGVSQFAVLDDDSSDGTREFLLAQSDVDVFTSDVSYTTMTRQAWLARLIEFYGFGRWYLAVDSDELLTYEGCEEKGIEDLIRELEVVGYKSGRALLLDMYGEGSFYYPENFDESNPYAGIEFFDPGGFQVIESLRYFGIAGGMRSRVFGLIPTLTKHPIFYAEPGFVPCHSHYSFPYAYNDNAVYVGVLRHYKFLPTDKLKYDTRASAGTFYGGSTQYKSYARAASEGALSAYAEGISQKYVDSSSLSLIQLPEGFDNRPGTLGRW